VKVHTCTYKSQTVSVVWLSDHSEYERFVVRSPVGSVKQLKNLTPVGSLVDVNY